MKRNSVMLVIPWESVTPSMDLVLSTKSGYWIRFWQGRRDSNPRPTVLEFASRRLLPSVTVRFKYG